MSRNLVSEMRRKISVILKPLYSISPYLYSIC